MNTNNHNKPLRAVVCCILFIALALFGGQCVAGTALKNCYDLPGVIAPTISPNKALHVFIDQTMAITAEMKTSVVELVSEWGSNGERVTISRFSANIKGNFSELVFDQIGNIPPTEPFLFHLRRKHKKSILACIKEHKGDFHNSLVEALTNTLKISSDALPKTNLIHSLNDFADQLVADKTTSDKTVLIISDGLENSDLFSFHKRNKIRKINYQKMLNIVRRKNLIPNWFGAKIYLLGLGYISDSKVYVRPKLIKPLKKFWTKYFLEGDAVIEINSIGTPMLLTKSILK